MYYSLCKDGYSPWISAALGLERLVTFRLHFRYITFFWRIIRLAFSYYIEKYYFCSIVANSENGLLKRIIIVNIRILSWQK